MRVYQAICNVIQDLSAVGISKSKKNTQQNYNFRGVDDVMNALAPLLAKHGLVILPRVVNREVVERTGKSGGALFYVTVTAEFDFVASEDGSKHTVVTAGEAMDSGDKATNKAMSAAYKYACLQAFCVPTEAADADAETHEVLPAKQPIQAGISKKDHLLMEIKTMRMNANINPEQAVDVMAIGDPAKATEQALEKGKQRLAYFIAFAQSKAG